jgi:hypothetical protein
VATVCRDRHEKDTESVQQQEPELDTPVFSVLYSNAPENDDESGTCGEDVVGPQDSWSAVVERNGWPASDAGRTIATEELADFSKGVRLLNRQADQERKEAYLEDHRNLKARIAAKEKAEHSGRNDQEDEVVQEHQRGLESLYTKDLVPVSDVTRPNKDAQRNRIADTLIRNDDLVCTQQPGKAVPTKDAPHASAIEELRIISGDASQPKQSHSRHGVGAQTGAEPEIQNNHFDEPSGRLENSGDHTEELDHLTKDKALNPRLIEQTAARPPISLILPGVEKKRKHSGRTIVRRRSECWIRMRPAIMSQRLDDKNNNKSGIRSCAVRLRSWYLLRPT